MRKFNCLLEEMKVESVISLDVAERLENFSLLV